MHRATLIFNAVERVQCDARQLVTPGLKANASPWQVNLNGRWRRVLYGVGGLYLGRPGHVVARVELQPDEAGVRATLERIGKGRDPVAEAARRAADNPALVGRIARVLAGRKP
jgi:hypothetical protein